MSMFLNWLLDFFRNFTFLAIVMPWERAARVRLGANVKIWEPGWHIRLPFIDTVICVNTRLRIAGIGTQTLTTSDGHLLNVNLNIGFCITDPLLAMNRLQWPERAAAALATSAIAQYICTTRKSELFIDELEAHVTAQLATEPAFKIEFVKVSDFAYTRAIRLISDSHSREVHIDDRKL